MLFLTIDPKPVPLKVGHEAACLLHESNKPFPELQDEERQAAPQKPIKDDLLISIRNVKTWFPVHKGVFRKIANYVKAVDNVDLDQLFNFLSGEVPDSIVSGSIRSSASTNRARW